MKARPCLTRKCLLLWGHAGDTITPTIFSTEKIIKNYNILCLLGPYCSNFSETEIITFM